ncbi:hypothetical protein BCR33DRAFT_723246 [Rhizoclosmatium globosum]|uniref:ATP-dependent helicase CHD1-2/hrp3 HTH domain-containing protein n=1 Tax=Rhizoclosmatium globosum TaxID=329046 RepID=A0A1Y2BEL7_9FUNG|nr:hypothetical protein BCR33DRAFT_723246 [Rhizoclosmatium globosum]|eukprot:ORY33271.1 hypothetical protein BCR33DRAFT_723246 [Rhizoclosmatium globosum]
MGAEASRQASPTVPQSETPSTQITLTDQQTNALIQSMLRFGSPHLRFETIVKDASLDSTDTSTIIAAGKGIFKTCKAAVKAQQEVDAVSPALSKRKSLQPPVSTTINNASTVNATLFVQRIRELDLLTGRIHDMKDLSHGLEELTKDLSEFEFPLPRNWDIDWTWTDDAMLLYGVYKHGYGSWQLIEQDEELPFRDRFFLGSSEDKKPKDRQLCHRVDLVLKYLKEEEEERLKLDPEAEDDTDENRVGVSKNSEDGDMPKWLSFVLHTFLPAPVEDFFGDGQNVHE